MATQTVGRGGMSLVRGRGEGGRRAGPTTADGAMGWLWRTSPWRMLLRRGGGGVKGYLRGRGHRTTAVVPAWMWRHVTVAWDDDCGGCRCSRKSGRWRGNRGPPLRTAGLCGDLLTCVLRAWDFAREEAGKRKKPVLLVPAMNTLMCRGGSWRNARPTGRAGGEDWRRAQDSSGKGQPPPAAPPGGMGHQGGEDGGRCLPTAAVLRLLPGGPRRRGACFRADFSAVVLAEVVAELGFVAVVVTAPLWLPCTD